MRNHLLIIPMALALVLQACGTPDPETTGTTTPADTIAVSAPQNGPQVIHMQDGGRMEGELVDGKRIGAWASYFPNGGIRSKANYSEGVEVGPTEVFHENGMTYYTGQYNNGRPTGQWIFYDPTGQETERVMYDAEGKQMK